MRYSRHVPILLFCFFGAYSHALTFSVRPGPPFVSIQVGSATQLDTVTFTVPPGASGNATPIVGAPVVEMTVLGYSGSNQSNYQLTVNSSSGLVSGSGARIPFSNFSWTTRDGDIPAGRFNDSSTQLILFEGHGNRARGITDYLTFQYDNALVYPGGTYTGRLVYTVTQL